MQLKTFSGFKAQHVAASPCSCLAAQRAGKRQTFRLVVTANKKGNKQQQVVLMSEIPSLGVAGDLVTVKAGYARNFLAPKGLAKPATAGVLRNIEEQKTAELRAMAQVKAKAQAMATALQTISKFIIKKKVGKDNQIFGSVTTQEVVDAVNMQTGRQLDRRAITLPDIKNCGNYDAEVKLHEEVTGRFKVVVQKDTTK